LREGINSFIKRNFHKEFERYVKKKGLVSGLLSPSGPCKGKSGGVRLLGPLKKRESIYGFLFCGPRERQKLNMGAIWNFSKEQGFTELITDYGAQRAPYIRLRCIGTVGLEPKCYSINQSINTQAK